MRKQTKEKQQKKKKNSKGSKTPQKVKFKNIKIKDDIATSTISSSAAGRLWKTVSSLGPILFSTMSLNPASSSSGELQKLLSSFL